MTSKLHEVTLAMLPKDASRDELRLCSVLGLIRERTEEKKGELFACLGSDDFPFSEVRDILINAGILIAPTGGSGNRDDKHPRETLYKVSRKQFNRLARFINQGARLQCKSCITVQCPTSLATSAVLAEGFTLLC